MLPILHQSYWRDEAFSVLLASKSLKDIFLLTIKDASPPLYYFLLHFWIKLFGDAEHVARTLSLVFHFLLVFSAFFLLKHLLKNWKAALLGALGILLNPFLIEYAFEARTYSFFAFLIVSATLFYLRRKHLLAGLFLALAILAHNFAIFFLVGFMAAWLYDNREDLQKRLSQFALLFTLPILTFAGWLKFLWDQWVKVGEGFWIKPKTSSILVDTIRIFFRGSKDYPSKGMLYNLSLVLIFMGTSYWVAKIADDKNKGFPKRSGLSLVFLFSIPFLIAYVVSSFWVPVYHERFLIPILPLFIIWIAYSLFKLCKLDKSLSYFVFAIAIAYVLFGIQSAEEIMSRTTKPAINHGVKQVLTQAQYGDVIVPESNLNFLEVKYYVKKFREDIPVYAYLPNGEIPFYIGSVLFEEKEIINEYPKNRKVWVITQDGGYYLKTDF